MKHMILPFARWWQCHVGNLMMVFSDFGNRIIMLVTFRIQRITHQHFKIVTNFNNRWNGWWQWCWWQRYVGDFMMLTDLRCWWQNHYVGDFFRYVGDFFNVLNLSPTSWIGHQHLKLVTNTFGPTSVTKIDLSRSSLELPGNPDQDEYWR